MGFGLPAPPHPTQNGFQNGYQVRLFPGGIADVAQIQVYGQRQGWIGGNRAGPWSAPCRSWSCPCRTRPAVPFVCFVSNSKPILQTTDLLLSPEARSAHPCMKNP